MNKQLLENIRNLRKSIVQDALLGNKPQQNSEEKLTSFIPEIASCVCNSTILTCIYGEIQFIFIEAEGKDDSTKIDFARIRNTSYIAITALFKRMEFRDIEENVRKEIFYKFAVAVNLSRNARMQTAIEVTSKLRELGEKPEYINCRWIFRLLSDMQYPRFGTSGWRAKMGVDFSWKRAEAVAKSIVEYVINSGLSAYPLTIGYDSRINADKIGGLVAEIALKNGLDVHLASRETPSPALIHYITDTIGITKNAGLINCTPSHNPVKDTDTLLYMGTEYHGIRYNMPYGGVAPTNVTDAIGRRAMEILLCDDLVKLEEGDRQEGNITYFDPRIDYIESSVLSLEDKDRVAAYWQDGMVVIDEMHSSSRGYIRYACELLNIPHIVLHGTKDPLLGDLTYANPEPPHIYRLRDKVRELKDKYNCKIIGIGFDTDSDRFGVIDEYGEYFMMNNLLPVIAEYMLNENYNNEPGMIIRNMVTTRLLDRVAEENRNKIIPPKNANELALHAKNPDYRVYIGDAKKMSGFLTHVVPVGFKYIAEVMMEDLILSIKNNENSELKEKKFRTSLSKLLLAGEESNGMTSRNHTPDKDGLWGAILTLEMCAVKNMGVRAAFNALTAKYGTLVSHRRDVEAPDIAKTALVNNFLDKYVDDKTNSTLFFMEPDKELADLTPLYVGGVRDELAEIIALDEDGQENYITIRASGTEPINRIYVETPNPEKLMNIVDSVGMELEKHIITAIEKGVFEEIVDILLTVELSSYDGEPGTLNERVIVAAKNKIIALYPEDSIKYLTRADAILRAKNRKRGGCLI